MGFICSAYTASVGMIESIIIRDDTYLGNTLTSKMEAVCSSETSVKCYTKRRYHNPERRNLDGHLRKSFVSQIVGSRWTLPILRNWEFRCSGRPAALNLYSGDIWLDSQLGCRQSQLKLFMVLISLFIKFYDGTVRQGAISFQILSTRYSIVSMLCNSCSSNTSLKKLRINQE
jgi:hypothetical protein